MQTFHEETTVSIEATPEQVFEYLDDHRNLSSHMDKSSWMMAGSRMDIELDRDDGRRVGSHIRLNGTVLGVKLAVEEAVIERDVPRRKSWRTLGEPRLLVIGPYQMGFEIAPRDGASALRVFIDYELPEAKSLRWLRQMFALFYARWCIRRMAHDAAHNFSTKEGRHVTQGGTMRHETDPLDAALSVSPLVLSLPFW
jgi:polyketide cyclase/dehydrase/lipid transport protein